MFIRPTTSSDIKPLIEMLLQSGQFDESALQNIQETLNVYCSDGSEDLWFSAEEEQGFVGIAYCSPEIMADRVWNLLMLWVTPFRQRQGIGEALLNQVEQELKDRNTRLLLVETSSQNDFSAARAFYTKQKFIQESRIRNYYAANDDKLIFTKSILISP